MMMMMEAKKEHLKYPDEQYSLTSAPLAKKSFCNGYLSHILTQKLFAF